MDLQLFRHNFPLALGASIADRSHRTMQNRRFQIVMFDDDHVRLRRLIPTWHHSRCTFVPAHESDLNGENPYRTLTVAEFYHEFYA